MTSWQRPSSRPPEAATLQELAKRHLWMHFSRMGAYAAPRSRSSSAGRAATSGTSTGNRYLDGLSALFCVNIGHGREDVAQAGADQASELGFFTNWSYAHPPAIELAARIAELAPGDLNRVFFTSGGSEAVESAIKLARQYHKLTGKPEQDEGHRARDRLPRHHARGARGDRHHGAARARSSRSRPAAATCRTRTSTGCPPGYGAETLAEAIARADRVRGARHRRRRDPRAGPERRRLLRPARRLLPARARDLRRVRRAADLRRGHLLVGPARASGSAPSATTTSPTSSRRPRGSPRRTRRWGR